MPLIPELPPLPLAADVVDVAFEHWVAVSAAVVALLVLDLFVLGRADRADHPPSLRRIVLLNVLWAAVGLGFSLVLLVLGDAEAASLYAAGYLIERSLSIDNVLVFALIFAAFGVPDRAQRRVLFWGIVGALALRLVFILAGAALLERFHLAVYVFGAFLIVTGIRMATHDAGPGDPRNTPVVRLLRRVLAITDEYHEDRFWIRARRQDAAGPAAVGRPLLGLWAATPLFAVLAAVATTDVVFAVDSVPAILAITTDTFIVFTANAFALLGLRPLLLLLANGMDRFRYLQAGLSALLVVVGLKMLLVDVVEVPIWLSLTVIALILGAAVVASAIADRRTSAASRERSRG